MHCCLGLLLAGLVWGQVSAQQAQSCYTFTGDAHLEFYTSSLNISGSAYYKLKFKTSVPSGIVLYAEGDDDYEGLFVHNRRLTYLLTNPSPSGVEGTVGGVYQSTWPVNNNTWVTVEVYRNYRSKGRAPMSDNALRTGFIIYSKDGGKVHESHLDHINHRGVVLNPNIYLGGISPSVVHARGSPVPAFRGEIKDIKELESGLDFTSYTVNPDGKVTRCNS